MRISSYGIVLESMGDGDLELVRRWRNADHIRPYMHYQDHISPEMQTAWFNSLDMSCNLYFIITKNSEKIGVVNLKSIDWLSRSAEAGIFIGETSHLNTVTPVLATISLMEFAFTTLQLELLRAKIGATNTKVILFNKSIGYTKCEKQADSGFHYYETNKLKFESAIQKTRNTLGKMDTGGVKSELSQHETDLYINRNKFNN